VIYLLSLLAGLGFSGHCAAMCGGFAVALRTSSALPSRAAWLQLLYHAGKTSTYVFLGALTAAAGVRLDQYGRPLGLLSGALLIIVGAASLAPASVSPRAVRWIQGSPVCGILAALMRDARPISAFSLGIFNGFVPCGMVYGMLAYVMTLGSMPAAALAMFFFGMGTVPALALLGMTSSYLRARPALASLMARSAGFVMIALGLAAIARAFLSAQVHLHHLPALASF